MEIEVKVPVPDVAVIADKARERGFDLVQRRHFESNTLYDFPDRSLSLAGCLLRVRETPRHALLTLKGRVVEHPQLKMRPEHETRCHDAEGLRAILEGLGLRPFFRYEKYREEYKGMDALLCLDEMPFGHFLELEGSPEAIHALAASLGLSPSSFVNRSYADLYGEHCRTLGVPFGDIVFPAGHENP